VKKYEQVTGVEKEVIAEGSGDTPKKNSTCVMHYTGYLLDGTKVFSVSLHLIRVCIIIFVISSMFPICTLIPVSLTHQSIAEHLLNLLLELVKSYVAGTKGWQR